MGKARILTISFISATSLSVDFEYDILGDPTLYNGNVIVNFNPLLYVLSTINPLINLAVRGEVASLASINALNVSVWGL